jgi:hypothetical protein
VGATVLEPSERPAVPGVAALEGRPGCAPRRAVVDFADGPADTDEASGELPVEPVDPVPSANAIGIAPIAEPIPSATASAPTRPT